MVVRMTLYWRNGTGGEREVTYSTCSIRKTCSDHLWSSMDSHYLKVTYLDDLRAELGCYNTRFCVKEESEKWESSETRTFLSLENGVDCKFIFLFWLQSLSRGQIPVVTCCVLTIYFAEETKSIPHAFFKARLPADGCGIHS